MESGHRIFPTQFTNSEFEAMCTVWTYSCLSSESNYIDLSYNNFSAPFPQFLSNLPNLTSLSLKFCGFCWKVSREYLHGKNLKKSYNMLLQGSFSVLAPHSSLEAFGLSGIKFSTVIPENIGDLTMLSQLGLTGCNFSGQLLDSISQLTHLVFLDVSNNRLSGSIPSFSSSKNMTQMLFSDNQLTGSLLSTRWNGLSKLVEVSQFATTDEESFRSASLTQASNLSVEVGQEDPENHPSLRYVGLSSCRLRAFSGLIPKGSETQTFSEDSFKGNKGLCGFSHCIQNAEKNLRLRQILILQNHQ
ncbi:hypothetical protein QQ045_021460 [Rhodiola kirilowii]